MAVPASAIASTSAAAGPSQLPLNSGSQAQQQESVPAVQWDRCLLTFFRNVGLSSGPPLHALCLIHAPPQAGLTECCKALELDMLVMSPEQERLRVPAAIGQLVRDFTVGSSRLSPDEGALNPAVSLDADQSAQRCVSRAGRPQTRLSIQYERACIAQSRMSAGGGMCALG
jgi:hypothetical protein